MSLIPGTRVGHYEIRSALGAGGMGQVYVARDTQLNRDVALKVLPDSLAGDPERVARFTREAQTLASLNHPHIAQIHGFEQAGEVRALAMELVDGEDLSQRIARGALPIEEALPIARQIAEALEAAHAQGIIHRDLKPANVKVRSDGTVKVLDFGLAKAIEGVAGAGRAGAAGGSRGTGAAGTAEYSPTITSPAMMTGIGVILGTAAYMAPEQAKGRAVDRRCDIWAFGCVLFEMLTARRAFPGDDLTDVLAAVVRGEPEWSALPAQTPPPIRTLLKRCVEKDPARRIADPSTLRFVIDEAATLAAPAAAVPQAAQPERGRVLQMAPAAIAALVAIALAFPAIRHLRETPPVVAPELRLDVVTPPSSDPESFALSPDGRSMVFVASDGGRPKLWLRALDQTTTKVIPGTEDGMAPFWSPDGRSIGFFAAGKLLRLDLESGVLRVVADAPSPLGGTWTASGSILFTPATVSPIMRVAAAGGPAEALTQLTSGQTSHTVPIALPDGRHFVFSVVGTPAMQGIYLGLLDKSPPKKLLAAATAGAFLPPDRLVYFLTDRILTQRMDLATEALIGEPATMASSTIMSVNVGGLPLSASANGILAYRSGVGTRRALIWRDRSGKMIGRVGNAVDQFPALSPDGRAVAGTRRDFDIWVTDIARNSETRWTFDPAIDALPIWSPDSRRLAFASNRAGTFAIYVGPASQPGSEQRLFVSPYPTIAQDWSSDGRWLLYYENRPGVGRDLWALDMSSPDQKRLPVAVTPAEETLAKFSPDGRWVAYQTNASGRFEIVVKAFGDSAPQGGMWQVSREGGAAPVWSRDGKELYFFTPDGSLQASSITARPDSIEAGSPVRLFTARVGGAGGIDAGTVYCVSRDGRFLISEVVDADVPPITIVVNPKF